MIQALVLVAALTSTPVSAGASISPAVVTSPGTASQVYTVSNQGTVSEKMTIQVLTTRQVANKPGLYSPDSEFDTYKVSVPEFTLAPHASKAVTVSITGDGYAKHLIVAAEAVTVSPSGMARVHVAAMARWDVSGKPGHAPHSVTLPTPQAPSHSPSPLVLGSVLAGLCLALGSVWAVLRRRRRRTA